MKDLSKNFARNWQCFHNLSAGGEMLLIHLFCTGEDLRGRSWQVKQRKMMRRGRRNVWSPDSASNSLSIFHRVFVTPRVSRTNFLEVNLIRIPCPNSSSTSNTNKNSKCTSSTAATKPKAHNTRMVRMLRAANYSRMNAHYLSSSRKKTHQVLQIARLLPNK